MLWQALKNPCKVKRNVCCPSGNNRLLNSYADIVRSYIEHEGKCAKAERGFYARQPDLRGAINTAALSKMSNGKRHPHQRRLSASTLEHARTRLLECDFTGCRMFDDLFEFIRQTIGPISGIGELAVYDIAHRIGAYLKLSPEKVYLHAGVRDGAHAIGLGYGVDTLAIEDLPGAFHHLRADEIEDCLCIYKKSLRRVNPHNR